MSNSTHLLNNAKAQERIDELEKTKRPTMMKKDFEAIARSLRKSAETDGNYLAVRQVALDLLPVLKRLNPSFQEGKFMEVVDGKRGW